MSTSRRTFAFTASALVLGVASCALHVGGGGSGGAGGSGSGGGVAGGGGSGLAPVPSLVPSLRLAAGGDETCVLSPSGHVACWGSAETGQLGLGDFTDHPTPAWIPGLDHVTDLSIGTSSACARREDGSVWCWGSNTYGELGAPTAACPGWPGDPCSAVPVQAMTDGAARVSTGPNRACAVLEQDGTLTCWGSALPQDTQGDPHDYHALSAAVGWGHACVIFQPASGQDPARNVICYGDDSEGQLGFGIIVGPVGYGPPGGFVEIAAGWGFTCGVGAAGELFCWGENVFGSLGVDFPDFPFPCVEMRSCTEPTPERVTSLPPVAHVAANEEQACAVTTAGDVYCWGTPSQGSLPGASGCGVPNPRCANTPLLIAGVSGAVGIAVGAGHACALTAAGEIVCWGLDAHGQLGRGGGPAWDPVPAVVTLPAEPM